MKWLIGLMILGLAMPAQAQITQAQITQAQITQGQMIESALPNRHFTDEDIAKVKMPDLKFTETTQNIQDYDKYFFFHRDGTSFDEAYADITECDALASGTPFFARSTASYIYYSTPAGAIGGALGTILADAIFGSADRRRTRRASLRNCMAFKAYQRYGMERARWQSFNFEEGNGRESEAVRDAAFLTQAKIASGSKPQLKVLEP